MTTNSSRWHAISVLITLLTIGPAVWGQQTSPRIGYVYPAGGRQGTTFQVKIGGQYLDGVARVYVSGGGVQAAVVEHTKPLTMKQVNELREKLQELQKKEKSAETLKEIAEIRAKLATFNRNANPALAETVTLEITMDPNAEPGARQLRLGATLGLTNPVVFCVSQLPELCEKESSSDSVPRGTAAPFGKPPQSNAPEPEMAITLPAFVNGQIMPGDVDRYRFTAGKGQRLVAAASARELIPYLADAVPGWFQATLALYDTKGHELAYSDDYRFHPDPVLSCEIPEDGEYVVEIKDAIYRGREDFVYRIAVGELPFVTSIFPLGGRAGARAAVAVDGWNLPVARLKPEVREPGIHLLSVQKDGWRSNLVPFAVDTLPECLEKETNDSLQTAQPVTLPIIVNGRIDKGGDSDVFRFDARAGDEIVAEVYARRLGSPLDSAIKLTDAAGKQLAFNDDHEDKGTGLNTHHADSWLHTTLASNGTYYLHLGNAQQQGGSEYGYRLRIGPPRPDFELRMAPASLNTRTGMTIPITVYALRKDGFSGDITLELKDAPTGFTLGGGWVPAGQDQVRLTLTVSPTPLQEPASLNMEGRAKIDGREVVRTVVPTEDMMQAFFYRHLVPASDWRVAVTGAGRKVAPVRILDEIPVKIPAGGTARVRIGTSRGLFAATAQLELSEPPEGLAVQGISPGRDGLEITLQSDAAKVKPGLKGNLIVNVFAAGAPASANQKTPVNRRRTPLGTLPAIPFEIVAR
jgi:hypothetical protein